MDKHGTSKTKAFWHSDQNTENADLSELLIFKQNAWNKVCKPLIIHIKYHHCNKTITQIIKPTLMIQITVHCSNPINMVTLSNSFGGLLSGLINGK